MTPDPRTFENGPSTKRLRSHTAHTTSIVSVSRPLHPFPPLWQRPPLRTQHRAVPSLPASHCMLTHTIGTSPARLVFIGLEHYAWRRPPPARLHLHPYTVSKRHPHAAKRRAIPSTRLSPSSSLHCRPPFHRRHPRPPPHTTARIGHTLRSTDHTHPRCTTPRRYRPRRRRPCYTICRRPSHPPSAPPPTPIAPAPLVFCAIGNARWEGHTIPTRTRPRAAHRVDRLCITQRTTHCDRSGAYRGVACLDPPRAQAACHCVCYAGSEDGRRRFFFDRRISLYRVLFFVFLPSLFRLCT